MEFELDFPKGWNWVAVLLITVMVAVGLGALGRLVTPAGDKLLTWSEWQVLQARHAYRQELSRLRQDVEALAGLLDQSPDPVRAQLVAEQALAHSQVGQETLAPQRQAVALAAEALRNWAVGAEDRQIAVAALLQAILTLEEAGDR